MEPSGPPPAPLAPLGSVERRAFDYADLDAAMLAVEEAIRRARRNLDGLRGGGAANASNGPRDGRPEEAADGAESAR